VRTSPRLFISVSLSVFLILGCNRNPNVEIVGSYFPGWLIALAIGVVLALGSHTLLRRHGMDHSIGPPALIYPGMVVLFTCLLWLCFFA
jgi:hypothetical protein